MTSSVQYRPKVEPGSACALCSSQSHLIRDHCHSHGWVRDILCTRCNSLMGLIDRRALPREATLASIGLVLGDLLKYVKKCPECLPVDQCDLAPLVLGPFTRHGGAERRSARLVIRVRPDSLGESDVLAAKRGLTRADMVRSLLRTGIDTEKRK